MGMRRMFLHVSMRQQHQQLPRVVFITIVTCCQLLLFLLPCLPSTSLVAATTYDVMLNSTVVKTTLSTFVDVRHVLGVFEEEHLSTMSTRRHLFRNALTAANARRHASVHLSDVTLLALPSAYDMIGYACDAIEHHNVTAVLAFTDPATTNVLYTITRYLSIPLIAYSDDLKAPSIVGERPFYLQLGPSKVHLAKAMIKVLEASRWFYVSLITQDEMAADGFVGTFKRLTASKPWTIEDHIRLSARHDRATIDYRLLNLLENQSRVIVLHANVHLARIILTVAAQNGMTKEGYAWFVTEDVVGSGSNIEAALVDFPVGLIAVKLERGYTVEHMVTNAVELVSRGTERCLRLHQQQKTHATEDADGRQVLHRWCDMVPSARYRRQSQAYFQCLRDTVKDSPRGLVTDDYDVTHRLDVDFKLLNLVRIPPAGSGNDVTTSRMTSHALATNKKWTVVGTYRNSTLAIKTIRWLNDALSGPIVLGERLLRVATMIAEPFVMEQDPTDDGVCLTSVVCLQVKTKNRETLDEIFKDFDAKVMNPTRPYVMRCCQGLSIMLLEKLARDLNFNYHLYITADEQYGYVENGSWNGLVEDLTRGLAHMAVTALSITSSRSRVIDFTEPYFFSSFSILVREKPRETPIHAFMEPFHWSVWTIIACSATVVALSLSLLEWNSPFGLNPWGRKRKTNYTFGSGLNMVYAILFGHTIRTKTPKAWPSKWVQNIWAGVSIFIYSSYTANLAAFLAGKNADVTINGIRDPKLLEGGRDIAWLQGSPVEDYLRNTSQQLLRGVSKENASTFNIKSMLDRLDNETIDAYIDDTPMLQYVIATMDTKCNLRLMGEGFGKDVYGIGLPKDSFLKLLLSKKILEYHDSGFLEGLQDLYLRRGMCQDAVRQTQGEATRMAFSQHAGLYLLLGVGIALCAVLLIAEHCVFKWLVPYWRRQPATSVWKSFSMMFWNQRLYRIITSEELVSPKSAAREMMAMVKSRDFTKLFQKSVRKQERQARNKKDLFQLVSQAQWRQRRDERLGRQPSVEDLATGPLVTQLIATRTTTMDSDYPNDLSPLPLQSRHLSLVTASVTVDDTNSGDSEQETQKERQARYRQSRSLPYDEPFDGNHENDDARGFHGNSSVQDANRQQGGRSSSHPSKNVENNDADNEIPWNYVSTLAASAALLGAETCALGVPSSDHSHSTVSRSNSAAKRTRGKCTDIDAVDEVVTTSSPVSYRGQFQGHLDSRGHAPLANHMSSPVVVSPPFASSPAPSMFDRWQTRNERQQKNIDKRNRRGSQRSGSSNHNGFNSRANNCRYPFSDSLVATPTLQQSFDSHSHLHQQHQQQPKQRVVRCRTTVPNGDQRPLTLVGGDVNVNALSKDDVVQLWRQSEGELMHQLSQMSEENRQLRLQLATLPPHPWSTVQQPQ